MRFTHILVASSMAATISACDKEPTAPPAPPPPTIEEQIAAWNPRIVVEEPMTGFNPSKEINTTTPGDTICYGTARFRIDSANVPDSIRWSLGAGIYTAQSFMVTRIPRGTHPVQAKLFKRFRSESPRRDTVVERDLERTFVCGDYSFSLAIGNWVPVDPAETRIDTLRVLYNERIPGSRNTGPQDYVLGATRGCDTAWFSHDMYLVMRRYAVNFERSSLGGECQSMYGELALSDSNHGLYQFARSAALEVTSIRVRRVK